MTLAAFSETPLDVRDFLIICMLEVLVFSEEDVLCPD